MLHMVAGCLCVRPWRCVCFLSNGGSGVCVPRAAATKRSFACTCWSQTLPVAFFAVGEVLCTYNIIRSSSFMLVSYELVVTTCMHNIASAAACIASRTSRAVVSSAKLPRLCPCHWFTVIILPFGRCCADVVSLAGWPRCPSPSIVCVLEGGGGHQSHRLDYFT